METKKLSAIVLSASLGLIAFLSPLSSLAILSATDQNPNVGSSVPDFEESPKKEQKNGGLINLAPTKGVGLKKDELHLVNQGRFAELADKLSTRLGSENGTGREAAWLAFAYLYLQKCDQLKQMSGSFGGAAGAVAGGDINSTLIRSFSLLCDKKTDLAEKELQTIPAAAMNDAFVNYAFATLAGKQGKPQVAIAYTKRAVELAPDFAWGYRTIAFLQEKWLNQPNEAAKNYAKALQIEPKLTEVAVSLINFDLANNDYDQAIAVARDAIKHDGKNSVNYYRLADIYLRQWRLQEAAQQLNKAISLEPSNSEYHRLLALILQRQGDMDAAIAEQKTAVSFGKNKADAMVDLAGMQIAAGKQEEAVATLKEALDLDANNINAATVLTNLLVQMKHFDELAATLNKCAAKLPKNEALRLHLGDALVAAGKTDQAIEAYKEAANLNPNDPEPHTRIASLLTDKKDYENAAKEYTRSLNINSNSVPNLVALGGCEAEMDDYLKAEAAFVTALALHQLTQPADSTAPPTRTQIIRGLAALLFREGRYADAASQFVSLCEMDKDPATRNLNKFMYAQAVALRDLNKDSFKQLEQAYADLSGEEKTSQKINYIDTLLRSKHYDQALTLLNVDEAALSKDPLYCICLSRAYAGKGDLAKAQEMAKKALAICDKENSPHSDAFCQLGEVLFAKGDLEEAEKNANNALGINAKAFRAYGLLSNIAMKRKQPKLAGEAANKALEIDPYYVDAYLLLGDAQVAQGDLKGAMTTLRKAVDLYPGLPKAHQALLAVLEKIDSKDEISREQSIIAELKKKQ